MIKIIVCTLGVSTLLTMNVSGVQFDLRDSSIDALEGGDSFSISLGGISATLTAKVEANTGVLNRTTTGFGVNAAGSGDATAQIDGDNGRESVSMVFDVDVLFSSIKVSGFGSSDRGSISIAANPAVTIDASGVHSFASDNIVTAGQSVVLSFLSGNGFSFDSFDAERYQSNPTQPDVVTPDSASVPDGGASALLLLGGVGAVTWIRRQKNLQ